MLLTMPLSLLSDRLHTANQAGVDRCRIQCLPERDPQIPNTGLCVRLAKLFLGYGVINSHRFLRWQFDLRFARPFR